jgi:tRNA(Ile)-lysidine synthetase-like protein
MKYVVAVSGGIDSAVLLDQLASQDAALVVAHVNHGIRADSDQDEELVRRLAKHYKLPFEATRLELGLGASEDLARTRRYEWLETVRVRHGAAAIATAHHQDDVIETMVINLARGTGWRGLCSLRSTPTRYRPLLGLTKLQVVDYALERKLEWREDSTNDDIRYLRNRVRYGTTPRLTASQRQRFVELYMSQCTLREQIDAETAALAPREIHETGLPRYLLIMVPDEVAYELMRAWLGESLEQARMRDLLLFAKTAREGAQWSLDSKRFVTIKKHRLIV